LSLQDNFSKLPVKYTVKKNDEISQYEIILNSRDTLKFNLSNSLDTILYSNVNDCELIAYNFNPYTSKRINFKNFDITYSVELEEDNRIYLTSDTWSISFEFWGTINYTYLEKNNFSNERVMNYYPDNYSLMFYKTSGIKLSNEKIGKANNLYFNKNGSIRYNLEYVDNKFFRIIECNDSTGKSLKHIKINKKGNGTFQTIFIIGDYNVYSAYYFVKVKDFKMVEIIGYKVNDQFEIDKSTIVFKLYVINDKVIIEKYDENGLDIYSGLDLKFNLQPVPDFILNSRKRYIKNSP
jgi:hypothetical protein